MRTLIFAIALCFLFEKDDARFLEPRCKLGSQFRPNSAIKEKIVGGSDAPRVPWMAAIFNEEKFICGGTLITSSKYFLTKLFPLSFQLHTFYYYRVCSDGRSLHSRRKEVSNATFFSNISLGVSSLSYIFL